MTKTLYSESAHTADPLQSVAADASPANSELPNRLLTAFEVAEFVGCHEETVAGRTCEDFWSRSGLASEAGAFARGT